MQTCINHLRKQTPPPLFSPNTNPVRVDILVHSVSSSHFFVISLNCKWYIYKARFVHGFAPSFCFTFGLFSEHGWCYCYYCIVFPSCDKDFAVFHICNCNLWSSSFHFCQSLRRRERALVVNAITLYSVSSIISQMMNFLKQREGCEHVIKI